MILVEIDGLIFDLDGTVYLGEKALPGAVETITKLRQMGKHLLFISNKPIAPRQEYASKLTHLGMLTRPEEVLTSGYILGKYLSSHFPHDRYYVVGEENLHSELRSFGLNITDELIEQDSMEVINPMGIDAVIIAFDRTLDYRKLNTAYQALRNGAAFYATNSDKTCPMPGGELPDAGATIAYLEYLTSRKLELLAGKPSTMMVQAAIQKLGLPASRCLLIGDRLDTDIYMGQRAGIHTALVLTGVSRREDVTLTNNPPEFTLEQLTDLLSIINPN
jgi:arabinose operon protein AraL